MPAQSDRASYRWLAITLLAAGGVYAWYALSQYDGLNNLNQRQVSNAGAELKASLDNTLETIKQFNDKYDKWKTANDKPKTGDDKSKTANDTKPKVCDFVKGQPYLDLRPCAAGNSSDGVDWSLP